MYFYYSIWYYYCIVIYNNLCKQMGLQNCKIVTTQTEYNQQNELNLISPDQIPESHNDSLRIDSDLINLPKNYPYILNHMRRNGNKFIDRYFILNQYSIGHLLIEEFGDFEAKRLLSISPQGNVKNQLYNRVDRFEPTPLYQILIWLQSKQHILSQIIPKVIPPQGFIDLSFPVNGSHHDRLEIICDDFLPIKKTSGSYLFGLPPDHTIAMILIEKALAKLVSSYQRLRQLKIQQLFELIVGIPIKQTGQMTLDEILKKYYRQNYKINSSSCFVEKHKSIYYKFSLQKQNELMFAVWQMKNYRKITQKCQYSSIVIELIKYDLNEGNVERLDYTNKLWENKTILNSQNPSNNSQYLGLKPGNYLIHIYNRSFENVHVDVVWISEHFIKMDYRMDLIQLQRIKHKMIEVIYQKYHEQNQKLKQNQSVSSRFKWDRHRGLLCLKNQSNKSLRLKITIKQSKQIEIGFEDNKNSYINTPKMDPGHHYLAKFIRRKDQDVGHFYKIDIL